MKIQNRSESNWWIRNKDEKHIEDQGRAVNNSVLEIEDKKN